MFSFLGGGRMIIGLPPLQFLASLESCV